MSSNLEVWRPQCLGETRQNTTLLCVHQNQLKLVVYHKKQKHRQQMAYKHMEGDLMLAAPISISGVDYNWQLAVDHIMNSSLGPFLEFLATEHVHRGRLKELVCNWIHPLFLKSKEAVSKEDNPNWSRPWKGNLLTSFGMMQSLQYNLWRKWMLGEFFDRPMDKNVLSSTWAFKIKRFPNGLIKKFKVSFCARCDQQI